MHPKKYFLFILILGTLSAIGPFSIDTYLPGFPAIAKDLHTTISKIELSLTSFFIGISAGQLLYGPLLDRYGRKKPLYFGLSLYILASLGCVMATSIELLMLSRFLQAVGGCAGMVASRAMVRDLFPVNEIAKVFSLLMLVIGVSPIIAPTLGGYLTATLGWHYVFVFLTVLATLILLGVHWVLPDTKKPDMTLSLKPNAILNSFFRVLSQPQFIVYTLTGAIAAAGLYAYISGSAQVFMGLFKVTEKQYGWIFAAIAIGIIGSSQLNTIALKYFKSQQIVVAALVCQSIAGLLLFTGAWFGFTGLPGTIVLIFLFLCFQGFTFPNTSALALTPFSSNAGSASALMGSLQMALGAGASGAVSFFSNHTALPMTGVMACCSFASITLLLIGKKRLRL